MAGEIYFSNHRILFTFPSRRGIVALMENEFCISKTNFNNLLMRDREAMLKRVMGRFAETMTLQEMATQMERGEGAFDDAIKAEHAKFSNKTENVEIIVALQLADFYFPDINAELCFEMRRDFSPDSAVYDSIVAGIESDTAIDCSVKAEGRQFNFQIKRCPQEHLPHTRVALTGYIKKTLAHYGDMKGTRLVLLLQPNTEAQNTELSFKQVNEDMLAIKDKITFDEIVFVFNNQMQNMRWYQVFPACGYNDRPLTLLSDKYKAQQEEWRNKIG